MQIRISYHGDTNSLDFRPLRSRIPSSWLIPCTQPSGAVTQSLQPLTLQCRDDTLCEEALLAKSNLSQAPLSVEASHKGADGQAAQGAESTSLHCRQSRARLRTGRCKPPPKELTGERAADLPLTSKQNVIASL